MKVIKDIISNFCPSCKKGKIYNEKNIFFNFRMPNMNKICPNCGFLFNKEPGFFYGAMYVSYGLTVAQGIATYLISSFFFQKAFDPRIIVIIAIVMMLLSSFNMRVSRIIWIYMFKNFSK